MTKTITSLLGAIPAESAILPEAQQLIDALTGMMTANTTVSNVDVTAPPLSYTPLNATATTSASGSPQWWQSPLPRQNRRVLSLEPIKPQSKDVPLSSSDDAW